MHPGSHSEEEALVRYLLGAPLPDTELERIEDAYFRDDRYFDLLLRVEDDLIDRYVRGGLPPDWRDMFERHFLASKRRREKWEVQQAVAAFFRDLARPSLLTGLRRFIRSQSSVVKTAFVGAALVTVAGLGYFGWRDTELRREAAVLQARLAALERASGEAAFALEAGLSRAGGGNNLRIAGGIQWATLQLLLPEPLAKFPSYVLTLATADGEELWRQSRTTASDSRLEVRLPVSLLRPGDYILSASGLMEEQATALPSYVFSVEPAQ